ncbi:MAG: ribonuclease HI family protein [Candidatus Micrarchaeaceae archaeon]
MASVYIYTDGASRGNPGPSASGYLILDKNSQKLSSMEIFNGVKTNNFAEYTAIIKALDWTAKNLGVKNSVELYSDSELVIKQLNGQYKVKSQELRKLNNEAMKLAALFEECKFINVRRENRYISAVDKAINRLLDNIKNGKSALRGKQSKL